MKYPYPKIKQSRDPYNSIGIAVQRELQIRKVSYRYACYWKGE